MPNAILVSPFSLAESMSSSRAVFSPVPADIVKQDDENGGYAFRYPRCLREIGLRFLCVRADALLKGGLDEGTVDCICRSYLRGDWINRGVPCQR